LSSAFFFQAEDGIRAFHVTGVQTCALPISWRCRASARRRPPALRRPALRDPATRAPTPTARRWMPSGDPRSGAPAAEQRGYAQRSEEHTSELQSRENIVCRLLLVYKNHVDS